VLAGDRSHQLFAAVASQEDHVRLHPLQGRRELHEQTSERFRHGGAGISVERHKDPLVDVKPVLLDLMNTHAKRRQHVHVRSYDAVVESGVLFNQSQHGANVAPFTSRSGNYGDRPH
jgi:hypothetical protein